MSLIENLRGRGDGEESSGGKYNPFRILEIGESMVRYCDGIRIKNYNFLAILTSDRLVLIESAQQSAGTIAKEIPVSMIQGAVMERDEKNRPALAISMEVGGQTRLMKLVFTGLIAEPETECREWFAAINGYPPEPEVQKEPEPEPAVQVSPPAKPQPEPKQVSPSPIIDAEAVSSVRKEVPVQESVAEQVKPEPAPIPASVPRQEPVPVPPPVVTAGPDVPLASSSVPAAPGIEPAPRQVLPEKSPAVTEKGTLRIPVPPPGSDSIQISIEKPSVAPVRFKRRSMIPVGGSGGKSRYCMHCGSRVPSVAKFCPFCGKNQS